MIKIFKVFFNDLKHIFTNWAAIIIFCGLCLIPSLYAWVNIHACWDPYANTGNLPVAVVNNDEGTVLKNQTINVGDEVIKNLKKNKNIHWIFVDNWQGNYGLNEGKYYAMIEIPRDFSARLASLTTSNPIKPDIIYKVNEKLNAIATKITNVAKNKLTDEIKSNFVSTVNKEAFRYLNELGKQLEVNKPQIIQLKNTIDDAQKDLNLIKNNMSSSYKTFNDLSKFFNNKNNDVPKLINQINILQKNATNDKDLIYSVNENLNIAYTNAKNDFSRSQNLNNELNSLINNIQISGINPAAKNIQKQNLDKIDKKIDSLVLNLNNFNIALDNLNKFKPSYVLQKTLKTSKEIQSNLNEEKQNTAKLKQLIDKDDEPQISSIKDNLNKPKNNINDRFNDISSFINLDLMPFTNDISNSLTEKINILDSVLDTCKSIVPQLTALNNYGSSSSKLISKNIGILANKLNTLQKQIITLQEKTQSINTTSLNDLINLLTKNPNSIANFISSPIDVKEVEIFNSALFGVALTPFYTVLGIWVGVLLSSALLTTECKNYENIDDLNFVQRHFGKMLLFIALSFIQTLIVVLGDKYVLGVNPQNMKLLLAIAMLTSLTFVIIIFTLVSLFGNLGKAIAVIIMVFQIAGSGGIYPIQTNPKIFGVLEPLWPFTYAINAFREAIAGPLPHHVAYNVRALLIFAGIFLVLGLLKKTFYKLYEFMEESFKESGL